MNCLLNRSPYDRSGHKNGHFIPCFPWQCATCGWNEAEHARRIKRKLVKGPDGLLFIPVHTGERG